MVVWSQGAEAASQWAQRTAHTETINTDRPGMPSRPAGPNGASKDQPPVLSEGSAGAVDSGLVLPTGQKEEA